MNPDMHTHRRKRISPWPGTPLAGLLLICLLAAMPIARAEEPPESPATQPCQPPAAADDDAPLPPDRPHRKPRPDPKVDDQTLLNTLKEFYPEQARRLHALKEKDPEEFRRRVGQIRPWLRELRDARARNPELARLLVQKHETEMTISDWQRRYREASPEQRKELMAEGNQLAEQRVSTRLQYGQVEIQVLEKRLENLRTRLQEREKRKDEAVKRELRNMTNPPPATQPAEAPSRDDK